MLAPLFHELIGAQLSAVTFVMDYLQLQFDGRTINVFNPLTIMTEAGSIQSWNPGFRDLLCSQITKKVKEVQIMDGEKLLLFFEDLSEIHISLKEEDYTCAEAIYAFGFSDHQWCVI